MNAARIKAERRKVCMREMVIDGKKQEQIAEELDVSVRTIQRYMDEDRKEKMSHTSHGENEEQRIISTISLADEFVSWAALSKSGGVGRTDG